MFELIGDHGLHSLHDTKADALAAARTAGSEAFEILDENGTQVHVEYPRPQWA